MTAIPIIALFLFFLLTVLLNRARFFLFADRSVKIKIRFLFFTFSVNQNAPKRQQSKKKQKKKINAGTVRVLLKAVAHLLVHGIRVERLRVKSSLALAEPSETAVAYGGVCTLVPLMTSVLSSAPRNGRINVSVIPDFTKNARPSFYGFLVLSVRPIDVLIALVHAIFT